MLWIAGLCAVCFGICLPLFMHYKRSLRLHLASSYKVTGTLCAFLPALIAALRLDPRCYVCAGAILLYAVADYLLEFSPLLGAGFFLAGHICNISFFLNLVPVSVLHLICLLLLGGMMAFVCFRFRKQLGKQLPAFAVYGTSLVFMSACAIGCFPSGTLAGILIACGGALFYLSDAMLIRRTLFPSDISLSWAIMITYYAANLLFGIACLQL